jgi:hypothetical protein
MTITISHNSASIDPSAVYSDELFAEVQNRLESEYTKAILAVYPDAEIDFNNDDNGGIAITNADDDVRYDVQTICETVFETGLFW